MQPGLKRFILWDYPRGGWQFDVICITIIVFIFATPRQWFHDQSRIPHASQITSLSTGGEAVFWIENELVDPIPEAERLEKLSKVLSVRTGKAQQLTRIAPILDAEQEVKGYMAFARP